MSSRKSPTAPRSPAPARANPPTPASIPTWQRWLPFGLIAAAVAFAYFNATAGEFVFDDEISIVENPAIRSLRHLGDAMFPHGGLAISGRPLVGLSLAINYAIGGYNTFGYHVFNIAIHALTAMLLYDVLRRIFTRLAIEPAMMLATAASLLWAVHPLNTDTVAYIINRAEGMMGLFMVASVWAMLCSIDSRRAKWWLAASVVLAVCSACCKEVGATTPIVLLLVDALVISRSWIEPFRRRRWFYAALPLVWLTTALLLGLAVDMMSKTGGGTTRLTPWIYLQMQAQVILRYLRLSIWPSGLCVCYVDWPVPASVFDVLPAGLVIVALLVATAWLVIRRHPAGLVGACLFVILAPTSSFIPLGSEIAAERRMYVPLAAIVAGAVAGVWWLIRRLPRAGQIGGAVTAVLVLAMAVATQFRNDDFANDLVLWSDTYHKRPNNPRALNNLGVALQQHGDNEAALPYFDQALQITPGWNTARINRGVTLEALGRYPEAIAEFQRAAAAEPANTWPQACIGSVLWHQGDHAGAEAIWQSILSRQPNNQSVREMRDAARAGK